MNTKVKKQKISKKNLQLFEDNKAIRIDLGCGARKQPGSIGMDVRPLPGVDIVHNINMYPWPIPDDVASLVMSSHLVEHIPKAGTPPQIGALVDLLIKKKVLTKDEVEKTIGETEVFSYLMRYMDECWRILKPGGQIMMTLPYAGSPGYYQDPSHTSPISEATWFYFDPEHTSQLWNIYKSKPWKIELNTFNPIGNLEILMSKRELKKEYEETYQN